MITSGRRPKRPDGAEYRRMRREKVAGRTLLEVGQADAGPRGSVLRGLARPFALLAQLIRPR